MVGGSALCAVQRRCGQGRDIETSRPLLIMHRDWWDKSKELLPPREKGPEIPRPIRDAGWKCFRDESRRADG
jgi:hypothetical protein